MTWKLTLFGHKERWNHSLPKRFTNDWFYDPNADIVGGFGVDGGPVGLLDRLIMLNLYEYM